MCWVCETNLIGNGEVMLGEVAGRMPSVGRNGGAVTECVVAEMYSGMEGGVIQAYLGCKDRARELGVHVCVYIYIYIYISIWAW